MRLPQSTAVLAYVLGAVVGATVYGNVRIIGGAMLNNAASWPAFVAVYSRIDIVPIVVLRALVWFVGPGLLAFVLLRKANRLTLSWFAAIGAICGVLASPVLIVVSWSIMSALAGAVAAVVCFLVAWALTTRSTGPASTGLLSRVRRWSRAG